MQNNKIIIVRLIVFLLCGYSVQAQKWFEGKGHGSFSFSMISKSSSSYFNNDGNRESGLLDSIVQSTYTFDYGTTIISLDGEYALTDDVKLSASLPIAFHTLIEKYVTDSLGNRPIRNELSSTFIQHLALEARYQFIDRQLKAAISAGYRLPPNIGKPQDTSQSFLGGLSHEELLGMHFYVPMEKSWIALSGTYAFKDNGWQNMIYIHGETGFSSVENTALTFFVDVLQPMGAARDIPPFDIRRFQTAEYAIIPGASFKVTLKSGLMFNALYSLRVIGATSWATGTVMLSAGYAF